MRAESAVANVFEVKQHPAEWLQTDEVALRLRMPAAWALRSPQALASRGHASGAR
jgi:hypothetical protein